MTIKTLLKYFLIWQIGIIFVTSIAIYILPLRKSDTYLGGGITKYLKKPLLNSRSNYDGVHYILIATHGYNFGQQAFFPLYPTLIREFRKLVVDPILSGVLISSVSFFIGLIYLRRLIEIDHPKIVTKWTIIALLAVPTSFFFTSVYTEGLFFLLIVTSFYSARKSNWLLAGILGGLASYTRFVGVFIFPALLVELWSQSQSKEFPIKKTLINAAYLLLIPIGILTYMNYLKDTTGDPLAFYHVQKLFNQSRSLSIVMPYQVYWRYVKMLLTVTHQDPSYLTLWLEFVTGLVFSLLTFISLFRQRLSYAIFNLFAFAIPTFTGNLVSLPRYVLVCFPAFILIGQLLAKYPQTRKSFLTAVIFLNIVFLAMFVNGYWVS
jgi:Gpi18-like mannosyltransferase